MSKENMAERALAHHSVFAGHLGLRQLAERDEFWEKQPHGTRFYFDPCAGDYLHRHILRAAIRALDEYGATLDERQKAAGDDMSNRDMGGPASPKGWTVEYSHIDGGRCIAIGSPNGGGALLFPDDKQARLASLYEYFDAMLAERRKRESGS